MARLELDPAYPIQSFHSERPAKAHSHDAGFVIRTDAADGTGFPVQRQRAGFRPTQSRLEKRVRPGDGMVSAAGRTASLK